MVTKMTNKKIAESRNIIKKEKQKIKEEHAWIVQFIGEDSLSIKGGVLLYIPIVHSMNCLLPMEQTKYH